jgi:hypothetical protein
MTKQDAHSTISPCVSAVVALNIMWLIEKRELKDCEYKLFMFLMLLKELGVRVEV